MAEMFKSTGTQVLSMVIAVYFYVLVKSTVSEHIFTNIQPQDKPMHLEFLRTSMNHLAYMTICFKFL